MLICNDFSKKPHVIFKKPIWLILTVFKLLNMGAKFRSRNIQKYDSGKFTPTPRPSIMVSKYVVWNRVNSDTLNYKLFLLQSMSHLFLLFTFVLNKIFCSKIYLIHFLVWLGVTFVVTVLKILCFWCSFYKVIVN